MKTQLYAVTMEHDGVKLYGVKPKIWLTRDGFMVDGIPAAEVEPSRRNCVKGEVRNVIPSQAKALYNFFKYHSDFQNVQLVRAEL